MSFTLELLFQLLRLMGNVVFTCSVYTVRLKKARGSGAFGVDFICDG